MEPLGVEVKLFCSSALLEGLQLAEFGVPSVEGEEVVVFSGFHDLSFVEDADEVGIPDGGEAVCDDDGSAVFQQFSRASWTSLSDSVSRDEVASSRIRISGFLRIALAMLSRCRCPPESLLPRSPITVS